MNEVSKNPLRRSTIPFDSGSRGRSCTILVASVPVNAATPSASRPPRPMPDSLSQISRRGTRPSCWISSHDPSSRSSVCAGRDHPPGDEPRMRRGDHQHRQQRRAAVLQRDPLRREPQITLRRITRRPDQPVRRIRRDGTRPQPPRRSPGTTMIDPSQPTRSAITVAGISGILRQQLPHPRPRTARTTSAPACAHTSAAHPTPPPGRPSTCRYPAAARPAAAEHHPRPAAGSTPSPPPRSPIQSVWVASFSTVAMASFSSVADTPKMDAGEAEPAGTASPRWARSTCRFPKVACTFVRSPLRPHPGIADLVTCSAYRRPWAACSESRSAGRSNRRPRSGGAGCAPLPTVTAPG